VYVAYAKGFCNDELIAATNDNSTFRQQARYLVKRRRLELWRQVLDPNSDHRHQLIDQVSVSPSSRSPLLSAYDVTVALQAVAVAVPECTDPDDVSCTVLVFMEAGLPIELIKMLEKITFEPLPFSDNKNLSC
jgi:clathrin heavy chain